MIHSENRLAPRMVLIITNHEYRRKLEQTFQNFRIPIYYQCQGMAPRRRRCSISSA